MKTLFLFLLSQIRPLFEKAPLFFYYLDSFFSSGLNYISTFFSLLWINISLLWSGANLIYQQRPAFD